MIICSVSLFTGQPISRENFIERSLGKSFDCYTRVNHYFHSFRNVNELYLMNSIYSIWSDCSGWVIEWIHFRSPFIKELLLTMYLDASRAAFLAALFCSPFCRCIWSSFFRLERALKFKFSSNLFSREAPSSSSSGTTFISESSFSFSSLFLSV